jgi:hypothetical protein
MKNHDLNQLKSVPIGTMYWQVVRWFSTTTSMREALCSPQIIMACQNDTYQARNCQELRSIQSNLAKNSPRYRSQLVHLNWYRRIAPTTIWISDQTLQRDSTCWDDARALVWSAERSSDHRKHRVARILEHREVSGWGNLICTIIEAFTNLEDSSIDEIYQEFRKLNEKRSGLRSVKHVS